MSWPVRDAACVACGQFAKTFPEESAAKKEELYDLWFAHLFDNINSVRENSATALVNVLEAYGEEAKERIIELID